jgi:glycosyltransferase involved in cell wall biosynthesis
MICELFPEQWPNDPYPAYKKELIKSANKIVAISNNTKQDLIKIHRVQEDKIGVIHLGCSFQNRNIDIDRRQDNLLPDEYLLFTGEKKRYKNFIPFIESVTPLIKKYKNIRIICAGSKPFNKDEKPLFEKLNLSKKIYHFPGKRRPSEQKSCIGVLYGSRANFHKNMLLIGTGLRGKETMRKSIVRWEPMIEVNTCRVAMQASKSLGSSSRTSF